MTLRHTGVTEQIWDSFFFHEGLLGHSRTSDRRKIPLSQNPTGQAATSDITRPALLRTLENPLSTLNFATPPFPLYTPAYARHPKFILHLSTHFGATSEEEGASTGRLSPCLPAFSGLMPATEACPCAPGMHCSVAGIPHPTTSLPINYACSRQKDKPADNASWLPYDFVGLCIHTPG